MADRLAIGRILAVARYAAAAAAGSDWLVAVSVATRALSEELLGEDLIARGDPDDVAQAQIRGRDRDLGAVAKDARRRTDEQRDALEDELTEGVMIASPCPLNELSLVHRRPPMTARPLGRARILRCRW